MDSFEILVATLLEREGYWTKTSFKVELTKAEKVKIGRPTTPRWELDVVAFKGGTNEILVVECKSFLDSSGVSYKHLTGNHPKGVNRYKLFNESKTWRVVKKRLITQLAATKSCSKNTKVTLCLAAGKIKSPEDRDKIQVLFDKKGWMLFDREWFKEKLSHYSKSAYENDIAAVVAKLLLKT